MTSDSTSSAIAEWISTVHAALATEAEERQGAAWGPVRLRHRTTRAEWFGAFDRAWALPRPGGAGHADVDLITAGFADLPSSIQPPPIRQGELGPRGEFRGDVDSGLRMVWATESGRVTVWDPTSGLALLLLAQAPDPYEFVSPLRTHVQWAVAAAGGLLVHAASVARPAEGREPQGLLILGDPGFGKSTSTLACIQRGWVTCGDDIIAVFPDSLGWRGESLYGAVKTKLDGRSVVEAPDVVTWDVAGVKRAHLLTDTDGAMLASSMRIAGLVALAPDAPATEPLSPIGPAVARNLAAPSTSLGVLSGLVDGDATSNLARMGALCREVPATRLPRRTSLDETVRDLAEILDASQPRVSVVLPVYNGARFVAEALSSIAGQTTGRFEVIAVDDGSTDSSVDALESGRTMLAQAGHQLTVIQHAENRGVAAARNTGVQASTHGLVTFLDQDDVWTPDRTAVLTAALRRSPAAAAFGRMTFHAIVGQEEQRWMRPEWFDGDHRGNVLGAALFQRSVFEQVGPLPEENRSGTDDVQWVMRLRDSGLPVAEVDDVVLDRRMHESNTSRADVGFRQNLLSIVAEHRRRLTTAPDSPIDLDVVIPVYNVSQYLRAAVESVLNQTGADVRVFVVDDGSDDDVAADIDAWADERVTVLRHDTNRGIGAARNTGVAAGDRPWVGFLDGDDLWPRDRTVRLVSAVQEPSARHIAVGAQVVFDDERVPDTATALDATGLEPTPIAGAMLFPRSVLETVGPFDEDLRVGEHVDWMSRARSLGIAERAVDCVSLLRRSHPANVTRTRAAAFTDYLTVVARARERQRELSED